MRQPDGPVRMSSIAVAALIQREVGWTRSCRSRRGIATSSGCSRTCSARRGLGLKALLCLGGDPIKIGDYPQGKQVSEVDVLGLLRMARSLNGGADSRRKSIGSSDSVRDRLCSEPRRIRLAVESRRSAAKIEAGRTSRRPAASTRSTPARASWPARRHKSDSGRDRVIPPGR